MELISRANAVIYSQREKNKDKRKLEKEIKELEEVVSNGEKKVDAYIRAGTIVGNVSDDNVKQTLDKVSSVINKALAILFPEDKRVIAIEKSMFNNVHPHFNVVLYADDGIVRTFEQSGDGIAQIVSFLFDVCLIDITGGSKIIVMDEILNGLHEDAKYIVRDLMTVLAKKFKFILTEYQFDIGTEFEVVKHKGTATVTKYEGGMYYFDITDKNKHRVLDKLATMEGALDYIKAAKEEREEVNQQSDETVA